MEESTTVIEVETSLILVMEEVHHKGVFPGDLKGSNSEISQAYNPLSWSLWLGLGLREG